MSRPQEYIIVEEDGRVLIEPWLLKILRRNRVCVADALGYIKFDLAFLQAPLWSDITDDEERIEKEKSQQRQKLIINQQKTTEQYVSRVKTTIHYNKCLNNVLSIVKRKKWLKFTSPITPWSYKHLEKQNIEYKQYIQQRRKQKKKQKRKKAKTKKQEIINKEKRFHSDIADAKQLGIEIATKMQNTAEPAEQLCEHVFAQQSIIDTPYKYVTYTCCATPKAICLFKDPYGIQKGCRKLICRRHAYAAESESEGYVCFDCVIKNICELMTKARNLPAISNKQRREKTLKIKQFRLFKEEYKELVNVVEMFPIVSFRGKEMEVVVEFRKSNTNTLIKNVPNTLNYLRRSPIVLDKDQTIEYAMNKVSGISSIRIAKN